MKEYDIMNSVIFMVYLDYSATTPVNSEVLDSYVKASYKYPGNANSLHRLGVEANEMIEKSTKQIADILGVKETEIIYTSGSSESNNLAILGTCLKYQNRGKHILTSPLEHSSIYGPLSFLEKQGFEVTTLPVDSEGRIALEDIKKNLRSDTILVTVNAVNSELGVRQPIEEIATLLKEYPKCYFHVDMTQAIGKIDCSLKDIDLVSFSAHKFYGLKGIGVLVKKENIEIEPLIHGGKSTTKYRSGTPALPLIVSLAKALRLAVTDQAMKEEDVRKKNEYLRSQLTKYEFVRINSPKEAIPHILNISILGVKPETMLHALEEDDIFISTQSACSSSRSLSEAVLAVTKDQKRASSSIRISLSPLTTQEELDFFLTSFEKCYQRLTTLR